MHGVSPGKHRAMDDTWRGLSDAARARLTRRNYDTPGVETRIATSGLEGGHALSVEGALRSAGAWIPGVELFHRVIHAQRGRGMFGEFARAGEGPLGRIGLWPRQWASARMFGGTGKGFHIHPPYVPEGENPGAWFAKLFPENEEDEDFSLRPYDREQWDVMFVVEGRIEMLLIDERAGMPRRRMRFTIDGDSHRGPNTIGVVIPPGVAHAMRTEDASDAIMVYGTSTTFRPEFEGRIASGIESASLPDEWEAVWSGE
jgi:dTDP-4-dehydrorhamnose 3,5-epimerase and related enzymes